MEDIKISAFTVSLSYNLEPIYSILLTMAFFGEAPSMPVWLSSSCLFCCKHGIALTCEGQNRLRLLGVNRGCWGGIFER